MPSWYPENNLILPSDDEMRTLHKLAGLLGGGSGGSGGSGLGYQQVYQDRDPAAPDVPSKPAISFSSSTGVITQWNGSAWV